MNLTFICQSCESDFRYSYEQLSDRVGDLKCPECRKRLSSTALEEFTDALDDLLAVVASLRSRFAISFDVDAEELPAAFAAEEDADVEEDDDIDEEEEDYLDDDEGLDDDDY